ncbi:MAG: Dabb family protein [Pseudomonadota bacterium]
MVKHLVMWRLRASDQDSYLSNFAAIRTAADAMRSGIDGLRRLEIGFNQSRIHDAADLALYSEFVSWSALQAYETHPLHEELKRLIGPMRLERRVVDYEMG